MEVLQLCSHPVIGWQDAPPGIFGLRFSGSDRTRRAAHDIHSFITVNGMAAALAEFKKAVIRPNPLTVGQYLAEAQKHLEVRPKTLPLTRQSCAESPPISLALSPTMRSSTIKPVAAKSGVAGLTQSNLNC